MDLPSVDLNSDDSFYALHHYIFTRENKQWGVAVKHTRRDLDLAGIEGVPNLLSTHNRVDRADRVRVALDAFVSICQPTKGNVLALSLTQSTVNGQEQLIFRLCGNETPCAVTVAYLQQLWRDLNTLADLQNTTRAQRGIPDIPDPLSGCSPPVDLTQVAGLAISRKVHHDIHTFCYPKTRSRLAKVQERWSSFEPHFYNTLTVYLHEGRKFGDDDDTHKLFVEVVALLQYVLRLSRSPYTFEFRDGSMDLWDAIRSLREKGFNDLAIDRLVLVLKFKRAYKCPPNPPPPPTIPAPLWLFSTEIANIIVHRQGLFPEPTSSEGFEAQHRDSERHEHGIFAPTEALAQAPAVGRYHRCHPPSPNLCLPRICRGLHSQSIC